MTRENSNTSRRAGPTENEIALQWEIRRLRQENGLLRRSGGEQITTEHGYLPPPRRGELAAKINRMWNNCVLGAIEPADHCPACGGASLETIEAAATAWQNHMQTPDSSEKAWAARREGRPIPEG